jgi:hypothetical protein
MPIVPNFLQEEIFTNIRELRYAIDQFRAINPAKKDCIMPDDMFFSKDERSLLRGKRVAKRTDTCRPCKLVIQSTPAYELNGVVLDITPHGMLIRTMESIPLDTKLIIQLMRDDSFSKPFSTPHQATVVRYDGESEGFFDHGIQIHTAQGTQRLHPTSNIDWSKPADTGAKQKSNRLDVTIGDGNT